MRVLTLGMFLLASAFTCLATFAAQSPGPYYLYEQLKKPAYLKSFKALFKGEGNLDPWLKSYIKDGNGVETPNEIRHVGGQTYELYEICKPHECPGNVIYIFFTPGGTKAWALFTKDDGTARFFGNPDDQIKEALRNPEVGKKYAPHDSQKFKINRFYQSSENFYRVIISTNKTRRIKCILYDNNENPIAVDTSTVTPPVDEIMIMAIGVSNKVKNVGCLLLE